jgi:hypothetical protein
VRYKVEVLAVLIVISCIVFGACNGTSLKIADPMLDTPTVAVTSAVTTAASGKVTENTVIETKKEIYNNEQKELGDPVRYSAEGIECDPIDKTLDCEAILLEKADRLRTLIYEYLNNEADKRVYKYGERYTDEDGIIHGRRVISDEISSYADYKALFSDCIYGGYFDWINNNSLSTLFDIDGALYGSSGQCGLLGTVETWYLGYDVQDDRIIGHFAELRGIGDPIEKTAEYLNDENSYWFYDIVVQNVDGEYVITDCREITTENHYDYYDKHGLFYNSGFADRSLITNETVKPKY